MKIALIGNMNNNFFNLVRYLRDRGIDAQLLLLNNEHYHFHPSHDTFDLSYQQYTRQLTWGDLSTFSRISSAALKKELESYDFIIGCGTAPAFLVKAGKSIDILAPYGSDFYELPFVFGRHRRWVDILRRCKSWTFYRAQKKGIQEARVINKQNFIAFSKKIVKKLKVSGNIHYFGIPVVYHKIYSPGNIKRFYRKSAWYYEFKKIRDQFDLVIFHHSRHIWKSFVDENSYKGNDTLIKGVAEFIKKESQWKKVCLLLWEYGPDVAASKQLIVELGIKNHTRWFPVMSRKEILIGLSLADIATGQFHNGGVGGGTVFEALALGKPLLHFMRETTLNIEGITDFPYVQVESDQDICDALKDYCSDPLAFQAVGRAAEKWYRDIFSKQCVDKFIKLIKAKTMEEEE